MTIARLKTHWGLLWQDRFLILTGDNDFIDLKTGIKNPTGKKMKEGFVKEYILKNPHKIKIIELENQNYPAVAEIIKYFKHSLSVQDTPIYLGNISIGNNETLIRLNPKKFLKENLKLHDKCLVLLKETLNQEMKKISLENI